jgi:CHAT domain-containing protein
MGVVDDVITVRRQLSRISLEHLERPPSDSRGDLLASVTSAEKEARRLHKPDLIAITLLQRSELLLAIGRVPESIYVLQQAGEELGALRQDDLRVRILSRLAEAHARLEDWRHVSAVCREGIALVEKYRFKLSADYLASAYLRSRIGLYSWGVRSAYELGTYHVMIERAELSKCRSILARAAGQKRQSNGASETDEEFRELCRRIASYSADEIPEHLIARRQMLWDLMAVRDSGTQLEPFNLAAVQSALTPDEAILFYFWVDSTTLCITVIDKGEIDARLNWLTEDQRQALDLYARNALEASSITYDCFDPVRDFGSFLLPLDSRVQWQKKQRLLISPHRVLHAVPFHAMRYEDQWLIQRAAISYIPNLSVLQMRYSPSRKQQVLVVGIENFDVAGRTLMPLPEAESEAAEVHDLYKRNGIPSKLFRGKQATAARLREMENTGDLEEYSCLHFATHGENVNRDSPMESHFYLVDSMLDGLELARLRLSAETVVLSACCSGQRPISGRGMQELPGDELFGLQAAFFRAGARRVLGTLWPVASQAARQISTSFHSQLASGKCGDPETALQKAICDYLATAGVLSRKVYFWAPFFLSAIGRPEEG